MSFHFDDLSRSLLFPACLAVSFQSSLRFVSRPLFASDQSLLSCLAFFPENFFLSFSLNWCVIYFSKACFIPHLSLVSLHVFHFDHYSSTPPDLMPHAFFALCTISHGTFDIIFALCTIFLSSFFRLSHPFALHLYIPRSFSFPLT
jgi:hypothetical protein